MLNKTIKTNNESRYRVAKRDTNNGLNATTQIGRTSAAKGEVKRIKTQTGYQMKKGLLTSIYAPFNQTNNGSNMFHPDIYHRPVVRKQYFCQLVDTYMKKNLSNSQNTHNNHHINKKSEHFSTIQTIPDVQAGENRSQKNSQKNITNKKRACTAGYMRKYQNQLHNQGRYEAQQSPNLQRKQPGNNASGPKQQNQQQNSPHFVKSRYNNKLNILNRYMKASHANYRLNKNQIQAYSPTKPSVKCSYEKDLNASANSQLESLEEEQKGSTRKQINLFKQKNSIINNSKLKTGSLQKRNTSPSISSNLNSQSRQKSESLFGYFSKNQSMKKINSHKLNSQQIYQLQHQIIDRLGLVNQQYKNYHWSIIKADTNDLYWTITMKGIESEQKFVMGRKIQKSIVRLKVRKYAQNCQGQKIKSTIDKVSQCGVRQMWQLLPKYAESENKDTFYISYNCKSLREQLFKFTKQQKSSKEGDPCYILNFIQPAYGELFYNNCEYLRDIIVFVARQLGNMNGKIINNKISLDNIYRLAQKQIKVGEWGCSALCRQILVNGSQLVLKDEPVMKNQESQHPEYVEWLLYPQNLPPQIIQCLIAGNYIKIWQFRHCPEVWCLGIIIFQIITCIPVWMPYKTVYNHKIARQGYLHDKSQRLTQIYSMQCKMPNIVARLIRDQSKCASFKSIHPQIISIMKQSVQIDGKLRPSPEEIIRRLALVG